MNRTHPIHEIWQPWEEAFLTAYYEKRVPLGDIARKLPRHTRAAIKKHATKKLGLKRPRGMRDNPRPLPGWERIKALIDGEMLSRDEIALRLGITKQAVADCLDARRKEWHIAGWTPPVGKGRPTELVMLGDRDDVAYQHRRRTRAQIAARAVNPFAAAAGLIKAPKCTVVGRVFRQPMDVNGDEREAA